MAGTMTRLPPGPNALRSGMLTPACATAITRQPTAATDATSVATRTVPAGLEPTVSMLPRVSGWVLPTTHRWYRA